jgi:hypothetical protein
MLASVRHVWRLVKSSAGRSRFLIADPFQQATRSDLICRKKLQLIRLGLTCLVFGSIGQQKLQHARGHLVRELSTNDKVEHEADLKGFAIEAHDRFVCAALPLNEKDQRLAKGVPYIIRNATVGSGPGRVKTKM